jgi:type I restriction enzyme S subunit
MSAHEEAIMEWKRVNLASLSAFITKGTTPTTYGFRWESTGVLFLRSECVSDHGLDLTQSMFISAAAHKALHRSQVLPNDMLVTITGNVGRTVIFEGADVANLNQHIARVRITDPQAHPRFIYHWLSQESVRRHFNSITTGQAYPQISLVQVRNAEVSLPPLEQQTAIAAALGDIDGLLAGLDRLIAKKRDLKQAAMQQLLTGQTRLPGFQGEWEVQRLGDLLRFQVGFPFSSVHFNEKADGIRLVKNRDLKTDDQVFHYSGPFDSSFIVHDGDVLVGMDGEFLPCKWNKGLALLNQRVGRIVPRASLNAAFAFYFLKAPLQEIQDITSSTTVKHLSHGDVEGIERRLPGVSEQAAIAAVLSDMDAEFTALEARRDKTRALKQGMMQELLTGRTRLV